MVYLNETDMKLVKEMKLKSGKSDNTAKFGMICEDTYLYAACDITNVNVESIRIRTVRGMTTQWSCILTVI